MAVLLEGISVVVRREAIERQYPGGMEAFAAVVPNGTLTVDDDLARVGFMMPDEVRAFVTRLEASGLTWARGGKCQDLAVVDQLRGPVETPVDWLACASVAIEEDGQQHPVAACWLVSEPPGAEGPEMPEGGVNVATPRGWNYAQSLTANSRFEGG